MQKQLHGLVRKISMFFMPKLILKKNNRSKYGKAPRKLFLIHLACF